MKKVLIRGPLLTMSGYGTHSRQVFRWLETKNVEIKSQITPWGMTPWYVNPDYLNGLVGRIMETATPDLVNNFDASFQIQLPNEWDASLGKYSVGITAAVETDKCNPKWIQSCNQMQHIVVPSNHTKITIENSGKLTSPLSVIPESFYDCLLDKDNEKKLDLNFSTNFNFLIFGQITGQNPHTDRKNTFFAIKWLCEEFKNNPDVGIIIKTNCGTNTTRDRNMTSSMLDKLIKEVRQGPYPKIYMLHGALEPEEIQSIYQNPKIKALVSPTRGEGYGLPLLEAAAAGLPVMATNWSGHLDFMNKGKFISFDYDLKEVDGQRIDNQIFMPGTKWAEVKEEDFKSKVGKFYKSPHKPAEWSKELSTTIKQEFSQEAINQKYNEIFNELL
jgi:glycosyltransferase involved in cell wall biosynthesis